MYFCSLVSELSNYDRSVCVFLHIDTGIILIGDVIQPSQCLALAEGVSGWRLNSGNIRY